MGVWQKLKKAFAVEPAQVQEEGPARVYNPLIERRNSDSDFAGYRLVNQSSEVAFGRDLPYDKQSKMQRLGKKIYDSTALGQRIVDIRKNVLTSEPIQFEALGVRKNRNKELNAFFKKFWRDNGFDIKWDEYVKDLLIYGEICFYVPKVNPYNGRCKLTWISPENIECVEANPYNLTEAGVIRLNSEIVVTETRDGKPFSFKTKELQAIRENADGKLEGNAVYFALNKTLGGTRGVCDYLHVADWIDVHRQIINSEADRIEFSKGFVFKCKVQGGENAVAGVIERHKKPPSGGSVLVTSDREEWAVLQPQLTLFDTAGFSTHLVELVLGGMGIPMSWYFDNSGSNNSSTDSMSKPIFTWAEKAKGKICSFLKFVLTYIIQEASKDFGPFGQFATSDLDFNVFSKNPDRGAYDEIGAMLTAMATPLNTAVTSGWIENEVAGAAFRNLLRDMNIGEINDPKVLLKNWNLEIAKAQANQQDYENIQKLEGKANLISRLLMVDSEAVVGGEKLPEISPTAQAFLRKGMMAELNKAKKEVVQKDSDVRASEEVKKQQAEQHKQELVKVVGQNANVAGMPGASNKS